MDMSLDRVTYSENSIFLKLYIFVLDNVVLHIFGNVNKLVVSHPTFSGKYGRGMAFHLFFTMRIYFIYFISQ